jgi:hypothetical protein
MHNLLLVGSVVFVVACSPSKQQFIERFEPATVATFCEPEQYFRQCFEVTEAECLEVAKRTIRACIERYEPTMPEQFDSQSGEQVGRAVGACAGQDYEATFMQRNKRINSARCNDPAVWAK